MITDWDARARAQLGTWLFLGANSVLFLLLFIAFVTFRDANASRNLSLSIGAVLTASILAGAFAVRRMSVAGFVAGIVFLGVQAADFRRLISDHMTLAANPFATAYFTLTGVHALYVLVGLIATGLFVAVEKRAGARGKREAARSALSLYWYFLAAVWVLIFALAYFGGAA